MFNVAVAGTGYVGLVAGVCFAEKGHNVICVDIDEEKVKMMRAGKSPIYEDGLEALMKKNNKSGNLQYTTNYQLAYENADFIFIGVGTPENEDGSANLTYVFNVCLQIAETAKKDCVVVLKSTVPIGTNDEIESYIHKNLKCDVKISVASNPEFLAQGTAVKDTLEAKRIVIGTESKEIEKKLLELYEPFNLPMVCTNRRSAEMIKYASNDFLALKISYMNDIANLCEIVGADVTKVAEGMSYDERIGNKFLNAGIGYGGSCFPKDTKALHYLAAQGGYELKTVKAAIEVNTAQKIALIHKARKKFKKFKDVKVAILGLTFKPNTDDLREAPSIENIKLLLEEGAIIKAYDPIGVENYKKIYPNEIEYVKTIDDALIGAEVCFIFTEWNEIKNINPIQFCKLMKDPIVYDGRNIFSKEQMKGIYYESIGR